MRRSLRMTVVGAVLLRRYLTAAGEIRIYEGGSLALARRTITRHHPGRRLIDLCLDCPRPCQPRWTAPLAKFMTVQRGADHRYCRE
jgi:hypothetical protein